MQRFKFIFIFSFMGIFSLFAQERPNIILIMSDDMGYSDIGCYGSEIETANLDKLAKNGIRFTQFYNQARCCPTRASLMTGLYPHQAGMGWMDAVDHDLPGYQAELNENSVTIAQVLKKAGYHTYMTGKWHLQYEKNTTQDSPNYNWPIQRGFDKFYGILKGAGSFYDPGTLCRDNTLISPFNDPEYTPDSYYFTDAITDNAIKFIEEDDKKAPFFLYMSYTAAHWPMQAPEAEIAKYEGRYDEGWDVLRKARLEKMKEIGLIDKNVILPPRDAIAWEDEKDKKAMARRMETYAAMVDIMDQGIGKIVEKLKENGQLDNTIILFLEDNGGNAEGLGFGGPEGQTKPIHGNAKKMEALSKNETQPDGIPALTRDGKVVMAGKKVMAGPADTYLAYLKPWAQASNTPFKKYKHYVHEGGIATPLIAYWPKRILSHGEFREQIGNVIDIMPTLIDIAGAEYPENFNGHNITPVAGVSLVPAFSNNTIDRKAIFWEHEMNRAVRMGKWKLVSTGNLMDGGYGKWKYYENGPWELYNLKEDRAEAIDISGQYPEMVKEMTEMWKEWADMVPVYPTPWEKKEESIRPQYIAPILD
jgi:arylsulfatase